MTRWALFLIFAKPPFFTQLLPHIWVTTSIYYFWVWENLKRHPPPRYYLNNVVKEYRARMQRRQEEKWNLTLEIHRGSCLKQPAYTIMNSPKCTVPGRQRTGLWLIFLFFYYHSGSWVITLSYWLRDHTKAVLSFPVNIKEVLFWKMPGILALFWKAPYYLVILDDSNLEKERFGWVVGMSYNFLLKWQPLVS